MNLYCMLKNNDNPINIIRRILLSQELQSNLSAYIQKSINEVKNSTPISFSGEYKTEEDEVLIIENFENPYANFIPATTQILQSNEIENIKTLIFVNEEMIAYQCFDSRKVIRPEKWFLIYSGNTYNKIDNKGLIIESKIDALFWKNRLFFSSYHNASKIFDLSSYYREASDKEIDDLMKDKCIQADVSFDKNLINSKMRKKLYLIQKNKTLEKVQNNFDIVLEYAKQLNVGKMFDKKKKKIIIPSDKKNLEKLINFLNDDLYKSPISETIYETNSKKILKND